MTMHDPERNQVGGSHYKDLPIQPARYIAMNGIGFLAGCVIKRMTRYNRPTGKGFQDLEKAKHEIELLIKFEYGCQEGDNRESAAPEEAPAITLPDGRPAYKFDLQRALAGEPLVTREGKRVKTFRLRECDPTMIYRNPFKADSEEVSNITYNAHGKEHAESESRHDLFMFHPEKQTEPTEETN